MAETETTDDTTDSTGGARRPGRQRLLGLALALVGAAGGFCAVYFDLLPLGVRPPSEGTSPDRPAGPFAQTGDIAFVAIEPLVISLGAGAGTHLRFRAQLEVESVHKAEVEHLLPRVVDMLNGYLRAVDISDLRDNAALVRLRAQMLRRVQMIAGSDRISDLLIMEFVLN